MDLADKLKEDFDRSMKMVEALLFQQQDKAAQADKLLEECEEIEAIMLGTLDTMMERYPDQTKEYLESLTGTELRLEKEFPQKKKKEIVAYTDGACSGNPGPGGCAGLFFDKEDEQGTSFIVRDSEPKTTNQRMELLAVVNTLAAIHAEFKNYDYSVAAHTDSAYIYNCWKDKWWVKWEENGWKNAKKQEVANKDLWLALLPWFKQDNFSMVKVAGHSGDKYNEIVDKEAVAMATQAMKK